MRYVFKSKDFIRADGYAAKPKMKNEKIERKCLAHGCGVTFTAPTKFIRLCKYHRENF